MTTQTEALNLALEALELHLTHHEHGCVYLDPAVTAIREALAQPEQEPVAEYIGENWDGSIVQLYEDLEKGTKLYTTPPQRKPLTDEQIIQIASTPDGSQATTKGYVIPFVRAIEAAHGIKE